MQQLQKNLTENIMKVDKLIDPLQLTMQATTQIKNVEEKVEQTKQIITKLNQNVNSQCLEVIVEEKLKEIQKNVFQKVEDRIDKVEEITKQIKQKGQQIIQQENVTQSVKENNEQMNQNNNKKQFETPTDDGNNQSIFEIEKQKNQQSIVSLPSAQAIQSQTEQDIPQQILKQESVQSKIKQYIKKITGKQVNSRIEYLCLIGQQLKDNQDIPYQQKSNQALQNEMWLGAYQDRRIQSHQIFIQYMSKMTEFIFEYLSIVETVFQQIKMRYKSSNNSFDMMLNYLNLLSQQIDYYITYSPLQQNTNLLSRLFTNKARNQRQQTKKQQQQNGKQQNQPFNNFQTPTPLPDENQEKFDKDIQQFQPNLCNYFTKIEIDYQKSVTELLILKNALKNQMKEQLLIAQQMNTQKISDYLMQVQGQRNITFEAIEEFYKSFKNYETLYQQNIQSAFDGNMSSKDLYDEEFKMYYYFRILIKQQQQFGLFTTYMLAEISKFECNRINVVQNVFSQLQIDLGKHFNYFKQDNDFLDQIINKDAEQTFDINNLLNSEQLDVIRKYAAIPLSNKITTTIYSSFATNFSIPSPESLLLSSPLILKKYIVQRDVAWERSLSFGTDFVPTNFIITVDGFLLFYDTDWKELNFDEPIQCHYYMIINELTTKDLQKDETLIELIVKKQGKIFDTKKKQILKMNDALEKDSLKLQLAQFTIKGRKDSIK